VRVVGSVGGEEFDDDEGRDDKDEDDLFGVADGAGLEGEDDLVELVQGIGDMPPAVEPREGFRASVHPELFLEVLDGLGHGAVFEVVDDGLLFKRAKGDFGCPGNRGDTRSAERLAAKGRKDRKEKLDRDMVSG
jgi:hypothetical protein